MAFVEFEGKLGAGRVILNPDHIVSVIELYDTKEAVRITLVNKEFEVQSTWDEVIEKLGQATDVYIEERVEATA